MSGATDRARGRKAGGPAPTTPDPIEMAMEAEASGDAPVGVAARLLENQNRLVLWQIASERAGLALKVLTGVAGVAAALALAAMAWQASRARGIVIAPFATPPALAQRGVTGEALAGRVMDQLSRIAETARSSELQRQVAADGAGALSLEIPATGVSLGQVDQWLRAKLGQEQRLSGELSVAADGTLALEARLAGRPLAIQRGAEGDLDAMVLRTAETIYAREQPRSWVLYLGRQNRWPELLEYGRLRTTEGSARVRATGYVDMARALLKLEGEAAALAAFEHAMRLDPTNSKAVAGVAESDYSIGHDERLYRLRREALRLLDAYGLEGYSPAGRKSILAAQRGSVALAIGDYNTSMEASLVGREMNNLGGFSEANRGVANVAADRALLHDVAGAREEFADYQVASIGRYQNEAGIAQAAGDWAAVVTASDGIATEAEKAADKGARRMRWRAQRARALAMLGRAAEAEAMLAQTPLDCSPCVIVRGVAAEQRGDRPTADHWFAEAVRIAPSIPFANQDWGRALLARGDAKGALARFDAAHAQSPRYPDAIEGRAEALLALGDARGAAAAFAEAAKLTPKWGWLHLKWGEALAKLGKAEAARAEWRTAAGLELTAAERAELQRVMR